jgi:hypothetical protein
VAAATNGTYRFVNTSSDVPEPIARTDANLASALLVDADANSLADDWEAEGLPVDTGRVTLDNSTNDTDSDGLIDGREISYAT